MFDCQPSSMKADHKTFQFVNFEVFISQCNKNLDHLMLFPNLKNAFYHDVSQFLNIFNINIPIQYKNHQHYYKVSHWSTLFVQITMFRIVKREFNWFSAEPQSDGLDISRDTQSRPWRGPCPSLRDGRRVGRSQFQAKNIKNTILLQAFALAR